MQKSTLLLIMVLLSACSGWHLRGSGPEIEFNRSIYLSGKPSDTYTLIQEQLAKQEKLAPLTRADWRLVVNEEQWQRRTASRTGSAQVAEYELILTINYQVQTAAGEVIPTPETVRIYRTYSVDQNDIAGKEKEAQLLQGDLRNAAARQILQQLQFIQQP